MNWVIGFFGWIIDCDLIYFLKTGSKCFSLLDCD